MPCSGYRQIAAGGLRWKQLGTSENLASRRTDGPSSEPNRRVSTGGFGSVTKCPVSPAHSAWRRRKTVATIGVGIIGAGGIALANHLPGFAHCPDTKVVALCDANPQVLEEAKKKTGVSAVDTDYRKLVARSDVHAVVIATPNHVHAPMALAAIEAGKHVLCEKPISMNLAEAKTMLAAAEARGVRHMTAFTYR